MGSALHALRTCLFTDSLTHSLTLSHMPDDEVGRALYSAHNNIGSIHKKNESHEIKVVINKIGLGNRIKR